MKKTLLLLLALTFCSLCAQAGDDEKEKIIVTLNDGSTVEGYEVDNLGTRLKSRFRKTGSIPNSIKISPEPDGKNAKSYKADDIQGYKIVGDTTILFESQDFDALIPFVKDAKMRARFISYSIPHISFNIPIADGDLNTLFLNATMPFSDNPSSKELTRKSASRSILWSAATTLSYVW